MEELPMRAFPKTSRWFVAAAIAVGSIGLSARNSEAFQRFFSYLVTSNTNCTASSNGYYYTDAWGLNSSGTGVCTVGESAETVNSSGYGSTAETICSDLNNGSQNLAAKQFVGVGTYNTGTGGMSDGCISSTVSFTSTASCSVAAAVYGSCPSGNTITGYSYGANF